MSTPSKTISFEPLEKALDSLKKAVATAPKNELERDGVIQRFEYTFEMAWKSIRKCLFELGRKEVSSSPKPVLRDALEENLISDIQQWFEFLEARNFTSHTYNELSANEVYSRAKDFPPVAETLLEKLKARVSAKA
ncbi:MAG: nucleotidyltransferase substrate binding protein [Deltaproteobacteria bacterium]|nr:nucleotidyltransferase substrate binding protein [Deltaproteobacteria bacterium]